MLDIKSFVYLLMGDLCTVFLFMFKCKVEDPFVFLLCFIILHIDIYSFFIAGFLADFKHEMEWKIWNLFKMIIDLNSKNVASK